MKKNWRLQCLICKNSRKPNNDPIVICTKKYGQSPIYYGSDLFTGFIECDEFDPMRDPFKREANK